MARFGCIGNDMGLGSIILESARNWPIAVAALIALSAILLYFYPRQIQGVGPIGWLLPALRWCGLGTLAIMLLRPVLTQPTAKMASGQILAVIDTSRSMGLVDSARTPAERVALARALGMLPAGAADAATTQLLSRIHTLETLARNVTSAQNDLDYAKLVGRGVGQKQAAIGDRITDYSTAAKLFLSQHPDVSVDGLTAIESALPGDARADWDALEKKIRELEIDATKARTIADANLYISDQKVKKICDELASQTRLALALQALNFNRKALSNDASALHTFTLGKNLEPLESMHAPRHSEVGVVPLASSLTDVAAGLSAAEALAADRTARAIILLTDGHQGGRQSAVATAVGPSGVPVYPINVAASRISDAWISNILLARNEVFRGQHVEGQVEVRYQGNIAAPQVLTVQAGGRTVAATLRARSGPDGKPVAKVLVGHFSILISPPPGATDELLRFSVASEAGEATLDNNSAIRWIKVCSSKIRVALISAGSTWDLQNLQHLLQRMPWVELNAVTLPSQDATLKVSPAQLLQEDIVVLHDVPVHALSTGQWDAIGRAVADRGGSVIVIAGTAVSLADYAAQPLAAELLPFHDLRPIWRQWPGEAGAFRFSPTPLGLATALSVVDPAETARLWAETQSTFRYLQLPDKNLFSDVRRLLVESDSGAPVITERRRGNGRVLFIGLDEMWRWGNGDGEPFDQRIWQQLIHHATGPRSAVSTPNITFDVDPISIEPGGTTRVRAWIRNVPSSLKAVEVEYQIEGHPSSSILLNGNGNSGFVGRLTIADAGDYTLRLRAPQRPGRGRPVERPPLASLPLHVVSDEPLGFVDLSSEPGFLERLARASGGRVLTIDQIDELPQLVREFRVEDSQLARTPIYSNPMLMMFVLACLSAEWALRKRAGLS